MYTDKVIFESRGNVVLSKRNDCQLSPEIEPNN